MEDIVQLLKKIQEDIKETKDSVKNSEINLLNKINEKFDDIQSKLQNLEVTVRSQEQRLDLLEKQARERNIVIFGVEEKEQNYEDLQNNFLKIFSDIMKIDCTSFEIQGIKRIGKKCDKPRPVIVTFSTFRRKFEILRNKKSLEQLNYYIKEDYPPKILQKRKELQEIAKEEREKGKKVIIKYDKLIVIPQKETSENTKRGSKRNLSETPPDKNDKFTRKPKKTTQTQKCNTLTSYWTDKATQKYNQNEKHLNPESTATP
ncbi:uncharacterized protein LOC123875292 [Maniola jurtina]|uniref:uncharacterized protein LOC123875292 n=1 Tax=Maniola jurtina TaxID=191418 RepID=UPI001E687C23|nr:uncharacterized protein LOC123875292 [Maniola jurtina]